MESFQILPTAPFAAEEAARFDTLQHKLIPLWQTIGRTDPGGAIQNANTLVVLPSLTADLELPGSFHQVYEERYLFMLFLLRQPGIRIIYLTSQEIPPRVIDYYLQLLPDVIMSNARRRLLLLNPEDGSPRPLVIKLLERPQLLEQIRALIPDPDLAHLVPFLTTNLERELTMQLGIPMYAADPRHFAFGSKSGARRMFAEEDVRHALGIEDLYSEAALVDAVQNLQTKKPSIKRLIAKLNDGVSGLGNTVITLAGDSSMGMDATSDDLAERVRSMAFEGDLFGYNEYIAAVEQDGAIVEEMIEGTEIHSPSVQMRISPLGDLQVLSTHDQLLGGPSGQSYLGAAFPANREYAALITADAVKIGHRLATEGIIGRFAIDFLVVRNEEGQWDSYAIEINLRKGGTTHPFLTLQYLTDGLYDSDQGIYQTELGGEKYYIAGDHIESEAYRVFTVDDLYDIVTNHRLHYDHTCQTGLILHMYSKVGQNGRLGVTAIHDSPERARALFDRFQDILDHEAALADKLPVV